MSLFNKFKKSHKDEFPEPGRFILKQGYLEKQGGSTGTGLKNWKKRWFVFDEVGIWYYAGPESRANGDVPTGFFPLVNVDAGQQFELVGPNRRMIVMCENTTEKADWIDVLLEGVTANENKKNDLKKNETLSSKRKESVFISASIVGNGIKANTHLTHLVSLVDQQVGNYMYIYICLLFKYIHNFPLSLAHTHIHTDSLSLSLSLSLTIFCLGVTYSHRYSIFKTPR